MSELERDMPRLQEAFAASWQPDTAYLKVFGQGNPALGQCYPTARVVQLLYPEVEIAQGDVKTPTSTEIHFWNALAADDPEQDFDLTWQQFPQGSFKRSRRIRDRDTLGDSPATVRRVELLLQRVIQHLEKS